MRLISLVLLSFIATNTVAIHIPKVYQIEKRGLPLPAEEAEYSETSSSEEATETSISNPNLEEEAGPSNADPNLPGEEMETLITNSNPEDEVEKGVEAWILNPPEEEDEFLPPDTLLLEKKIIARIGFLKQIVKKAMVKEQEAKDQAKNRWFGLYRLINDRFPNSGPDEPDNAPEELIKSSREAPSPLMTEIYKPHIHELREIITLVEQFVKSVTGIEKDKYTPAYKVIQNDAIRRSRVYLQGLADIGEFMTKTLGIMAKTSTSKDRSRLLELAMTVYKFRTTIENALMWGRWGRRKGRKGREDLVTSKEKLDKKKKKLHKTTILEETEDEEEEEKQDDKDRAAYEQSDTE
ncbi:hypothetical protein BASA50_010172 [Batrachochytrium salamandrivorans]|uniref:Uncharacterized protein n=1 Tax=Batrachochytrium salamandrivorans TaxID=1357716 RepID=A0ABQ8EZV0_9FUNG|nr:hypothetical protein BASA50_010172 [Batrachochytrium salamandrivorans]